MAGKVWACNAVESIAKKMAMMIFILKQLP
jgi:hypothetical protein